jgi:hypothetical protein
VEPLHFGLTTAAFGDFADPRTLASLAHEAEDIGWDGFFIWDHVATAGSYGAPRSGVDPLFDTWVALTAIAMSADRIPLGPRVTPPAPSFMESGTGDRLARSPSLPLDNARLGSGTVCRPTAFGWRQRGEQGALPPGRPLGRGLPFQGDCADESG